MKVSCNYIKIFWIVNVLKNIILCNLCKLRSVSRVLAGMIMLLAVVPDSFAQKEFERNLESISFVPKGQWITGLSVSYTQTDLDKYQFFIVENMSGDTYSFKLSPMLLYAFANDLAAGGRFAYSRSLTRLNSADFVLGADTEYNIDNLYRISHTFQTSAVFRNYFSLGASTRFGLFNEVQLQYGYGQAKICDGTGVNVTGTYETTNSFNLGLTPGFMVFLNNYSALEVNVGVLGLNYSHTSATTNQIYTASRTSSSANFKINLFSITFGVAFYI